jgi:hypothetical protein
VERFRAGELPLRPMFRSLHLPASAAPALVSALLAMLPACASSPPATSEVKPVGEPQASTSGAPIQVASASFSAAAPTASTVATADPPAPPAPAPPPPPLPAGLKVMIVGDSFAEALGAGMRNVSADFGVKAIMRGEHATFIPQWAGGKFSIPLLIKQDTPDVVIIALGGNELAMADPTIRTPDIEKIVKAASTIPCVWVGTPSFGKENDLPQIIRSHSSPCRYYDSNALSPNLPRGGDKIHPTFDGQKIWAKQVLDWLQKERDPSSEKFALRVRPSAE